MVSFPQLDAGLPETVNGCTLGTQACGSRAGSVCCAGSETHQTQSTAMKPVFPLKQGKSGRVRERRGSETERERETERGRDRERRRKTKRERKRKRGRERGRGSEIDTEKDQGKKKEREKEKEEIMEERDGNKKKDKKQIRGVKKIAR